MMIKTHDNLTSSHARLQAFLVLCTFAVAASASRVAVSAEPEKIIVGEWRLGDGDPNAADGKIANATTVAFKGEDLNRIGAYGPVYTANTPAPQCKFAMIFTGAAGYFKSVFRAKNGVPTKAVDNFGVELWVKPANDTAANSVLVRNGDAHENRNDACGWAIRQKGNVFVGDFVGVAEFGAAPVTPGQWQHLTLIRRNGRAALYLNGEIAGPITDAAPNVPDYTFSIGYEHANRNVNFFNGSMALVRVFIFSDEQKKAIFAPNSANFILASNKKSPDDDDAAKTGTLMRLKQKNPGLTVPLAAGLWGWPVPMDVDGDGLTDMIVSCPDAPYNGTYFFKNITGNTKDAVFAPAVRLGRGSADVQPSYVDGKCRVLRSNKEYPDFHRSGIDAAKAVKLPVSPTVLPKIQGRARGNQWQYVDYDGDGKLDLIVGAGDWTDYGWDNAFNAEGRWTNGPLHGRVYWLRNEGTNEKPKYQNPVAVEADGRPIDVYGTPSPNFADFTGSGRLDLICGDFVDTLTYFKNIGTRTNPKYAAGRELKCEGQPLRMDLCMIVPVAIDWDRDGHVDLVVGQEDGSATLLRNTGRVVDDAPVFEPPHSFQQQADNLKFGVLASPVAFDWDADGREDLVVGNSAGYIGFIKNLDGQNPPKWDAPKYLEADGAIIRIMAGPNGSIQGPAERKWGYTTLDVADWDHDGLPDLIVNSIWGKVVWYRNIGTRQAPKLSAARPIEVQWPANPPKPAWNWWNPQGKELVTQWRTRPMVVDFNRDGLPDLVMLDHEGYLALFERAKQNENGKEKLILLPPRRIFANADGSLLRLNAGEAGKSGRRKICLADWDLDGRLDLLADGRNVDFWRNEGSRDGLTLLKNTGPVAEDRLAGHDTSPTVVHWNKDGIPDLLIGAEDGHFYFLPNPNRKTTFRAK